MRQIVTLAKNRILIGADPENRISYRKLIEVHKCAEKSDCVRNRYRFTNSTNFVRFDERRKKFDSAPGNIKIRRRPPTRRRSSSQTTTIDRGGGSRVDDNSIIPQVFFCFCEKSGKKPFKPSRLCFVISRWENWNKQPLSVSRFLPATRRGLCNYATLLYGFGIRHMSPAPRKNCVKLCAVIADTSEPGERKNLNLQVH